ncbi:MAG: hypothetical protein ACPL7E_07255, partial [bacterium]
SIPEGCYSPLIEGWRLCRWGVPSVIARLPEGKPEAISYFRLLRRFAPRDDEKANPVGLRMALLLIS